MVVYSKILLVEGRQDVRVIPELIEANKITWEINNQPVVYIQEHGGYENLADPDVISTYLQARSLTALGIIIDADDNPLERWQSIRNSCSKSIPNLPELLPKSGLVHTAENDIKFGIWMMPDNKMQGMLETFLAYIIPSQDEQLWQFAQETVQQAKDMGASFRGCMRSQN
ncbi:DUF3226 domain-containing protein [Sphaerothrix gracilis]|uniref:DUF3226 domain-containing protein n=1 Tax=Sphaerothrix gracilis TaxID=3151835 RepID=UPI0031FCCE28